MKIILNNHDLSKTLGPFNDIGFVPTMGGIHEGHISLIKRSIKSNKKTIVSIFVNPKQFNNSKDFNLYPSNIKKDLAILKKIRKLDFVYIPRFKDVYENKSKSKVKIEKKYKVLCARFRKGHFEGIQPRHGGLLLRQQRKHNMELLSRQPRRRHPDEHLVLRWTNRGLL